MGEQTMIDDSLYNQRDEFFADIQLGDLVFCQADDGSEISGVAQERTIMGWILEGGLEVMEYDNYLGHISRNQLTGRAA
jgi:hypothetical protein